MSESDENSCALRICDTLEKSFTNISPFEGYEKVPLVPLQEAVEPLEKIVNKVQDKVWLVMQNCKSPSDNLSSDESASIMLYTLSWTPEKQSLYHILNATLRKEDPMSLRPWFLYLKLVITALSKLPYQRQVLYRGVRNNITKDFDQGKTCFWWAFTSCTTSINVLNSELFLGKIGQRTMFTIDCWSGKYIRNHSMIDTEDEVILFPGFQYKVIGICNAGNDLHMVQIEEIDTPHSLFALTKKNIISTPTKPLSLKPLKKTHSSALYHNPVLEEAIQKCQSGKFDWSGQQLNDHDIFIVNERGITEKQFKMLSIKYTGITQPGVSILSDAIRDSQFLEELNISHNSIADLGVQYLASAINNSGLKRINLSQNDISDIGAKYLAEMFLTNTKLIELSLSENQIGNDGIKMLADALNHGRTVLEVLNISANTGIDDESVDAMKTMIKDNQSLKNLDLRHCGFSEDGERDIQPIAKSRKKFRLWLSHIM